MVQLEHMRTAFREALVELGRTNDDVVALTADVSNSDYSYGFAEAFPDRFFNVGIAEPSMVDVAVGLAYAGRIPFANTFGFLFETRSLESIRTHCAYGQANVKLMAGYCGLSPHTEGPTHHAIIDIGIMRSLPGMTVVSPADSVALRALLPQVAVHDGPVYFRFNRNDVPVVYPAGQEFRIGEAVSLREGDDVTLMGTGILVSRCLEAADVLAGDGVRATVIDLHTIKPIDVPAIVDAARRTGAIVTAEEHRTEGGLGGAVAEVVTANHPVPVVRVGIGDAFVTGCGPYFDLLDRFGMSVADIVDAAQRALRLKGLQSTGRIGSIESAVREDGTAG